MVKAEKTVYVKDFVKLKVGQHYCNPQITISKLDFWKEGL
jgi:hypothetical protein